jgi:hypothetical protein
MSSGLVPIISSIIHIHHCIAVFSVYDKHVKSCLNFQGFHILLDGSDGFAGLGTSAVEYLEDEYSTKSKLVFPSIPSEFSNITPLQDNVRLLNLALTFHSLAEHSSLFVPLCLDSSGWRQPGVPRQFPHLRYNVSNAS